MPQKCPNGLHLSSSILDVVYTKTSIPSFNHRRERIPDNYQHVNGVRETPAPNFCGFLENSTKYFVFSCEWRGGGGRFFLVKCYELFSPLFNNNNNNNAFAFALIVLFCFVFKDNSVIALVKLMKNP